MLANLVQLLLAFFMDALSTTKWQRRNISALVGMQWTVWSRDWKEPEPFMIYINFGIMSRHVSVQFAKWKVRPHTSPTLCINTWLNVKFLAAASSLGAAITMPVCGYLIATVGWESVFYVTGVVALVWSVVWFFVVFDSPAQHPRISQEERQYIESSIGEATSHGKVQYLLNSYVCRRCNL